MPLKIIEAGDIQSKSAVTIEDKYYIVDKVDKSTTGKHGHVKVRIEAENVFDHNKKITVVPGHERFEVPEINKLKAQVLTVQEEEANIMDLETYETMDIQIDKEIQGELEEGDNVEYWDVEGEKIIKRKV